MFTCKLKIFSQKVNNVCRETTDKEIGRAQNFGFHFKLFISEESLINRLYIHPSERQRVVTKERIPFS